MTAKIDPPGTASVKGRSSGRELYTLGRNLDNVTITPDHQRDAKLSVSANYSAVSRDDCLVDRRSIANDTDSLKPSCLHPVRDRPGQELLDRYAVAADQ